MILTIPDLLNKSDLEKIQGLLEQGTFKDGKLTAGWHARLVKNNQQLSGRDTIAQQAKAVLTRALQQNAQFGLALQPRRMRPPLFSRYEAGMEYGFHVDDAIMGADRGLRTDISFTVFLNDPASYEGGELVMESSTGEQKFKLPAGSAITYPSTTLHKVAPVTKGVRLVAVSWVQSLVRSAEQREILYDLDRVRRSLFDQEGKSRNFDLLSKNYANLLRLWSET
ncbi:Fe2+-dependent dioxygenase [Kiloniella laminariae]|uniref:Fe2+-dependent dioxygenase n=1 Tax=Kiloniella laminariae TaxID=454162 RepID=UPI000377743B|nr:Fe2+-dependent dioxygenase [Kiloniella laminariae]